MTITMAAEAGQMELNAFEPVIFYNIFESIETMTGAVKTLTDNCVTGITANEEECMEYVKHSAGIATALCPYIGYKEAAAIAKEAIKSGKSVSEIVIDKKLMSKNVLEEILDPEALTEPERKEKLR